MGERTAPALTGAAGDAVSAAAATGTVAAGAAATDTCWPPRDTRTRKSACSISISFSPVSSSSLARSRIMSLSIVVFCLWHSCSLLFHWQLFWPLHQVPADNHVAQIRKSPRQQLETHSCYGGTAHACTHLKDALRSHGMPQALRASSSATEVWV